MNFQYFKKGYYALISLYTLGILLFAFVIPYGGFYVDDPIIQYPPDDELESLTKVSFMPSVLQDATVIDSFESKHALITIYTFRAFNSNVFVADVTVRETNVIRTAFAHNFFGGKNYVQTVSDMASQRGAILAINADYATHYDRGLVIRNGRILRSTLSSREALALWNDGSLSAFKETDTRAVELISNGAWQVFSFGPAVVKNGVRVSSVNDGIKRNAVNNPRTTFGWISDHRYMFVVVDGRTTESIGVDIEELGDVMVMLGTTIAYNFDGGGSSTMYFKDRLINVPSQGKERGVGDCVYIIG